METNTPFQAGDVGRPSLTRVFGRASRRVRLPEPLSADAAQWVLMAVLLLTDGELEDAPDMV